MAKWQSKLDKTGANLAYRRALRENPKWGTNPLSRALQKRRIKAQYAKAAKAARKGKVAMRGAASAVGKVVQVVTSVLTNKVVLCVAAVILLIFILVTACSSACVAIGVGAFGGYVVPSYTAEDEDIHDAEMLWTEMENDLRERIANVEQNYPDFDEYRFDIGEIGHDPFEIISFLSALYGDFKFSEVEGVLREVFDEVYDLQFEEEAEIRYREETVYDPELDEYVTEMVPYEWRVLNVILEPKDFNEVVRPRLEEKEDDMYDIYNEGKGGHQKYGNPLGFNWLGNVTSPYGYRQNPTGEGTEIHRGVDISAPYGTAILSVQDGTVTDSGWHNLYGNYVVVDDGDGRQSKYAHCSAITAEIGQEVKKGDKIAEVGSTGNSTGNHVRIEIKENGEYQNPIYLLEFTEKEDAAH